MTSNKEIIKLATHSAKERIESSKKLLEINNFPDAISRAYYGILDIARAALFLVNEKPKTHAGTIAKFNKYFIKSGKINNKYGPLLSKKPIISLESTLQGKKQNKSPKMLATF